MVTNKNIFFKDFSNSRSVAYSTPSRSSVEKAETFGIILVLFSG